MTESNRLTIDISEIERLLDEYETECIRYGMSKNLNTDKLQSSRKSVMKAINKLRCEYRDNDK